MRKKYLMNAWYLVPLIFGFLGGFIAWFMNKDHNPEKARKLLIFGIAWTIAIMVIGWIAMAGLLASISYY